MLQCGHFLFSITYNDVCLLHFFPIENIQSCILLLEHLEVYAMLAAQIFILVLCMAGRGYVQEFRRLQQPEGPDLPGDGSYMWL